MAQRPRREIVVTSTFDLETQDWDFPVLCGQYMPGIGYRQTRDIRELARWLLAPGWHWAHNGGNFDALAIADVWNSWGLRFSGTLAGGRIIALQCGPSTLCDSAGLWPAPLAAITSGNMKQKDKCPLPCQCGSNCGGWCAIRRDMSEEYYALLSTYLQRDCESLAETLERLIDFADEHDLDLGYTVGGSAYATASRWLGIGREPQTLAEHAFMRQCAYGGRTQTYWLGDTGPGYDLDVVNMYGSMLARMPFPVGERRRLGGSAAKTAYTNREPGMYRVCVQVPESHIPPLPLRGKKRVSYPFGTWEASYTEPELRHAEENYDVRILAFSEAMVYESTDVIFAPFVERIAKLRMLAGKSTARGDFLKRYINSLFGKLLARPTKERLLVNPDRIREGDTQKTDTVFMRRVELIDRSSHPMWGAYIMSGARLKLLDKFYSGLGPEHVFTCDTDGFAAADLRPEGVRAEIGGWEVKTCGACVHPGECPADGKCAKCGRVQFANMRVLAPKVYARECSCSAIESRAKGIRLPRSEMPVLGREYQAARGVRGARSVGAGGDTRFFRRNVTTRVLSQRSGDRILLDSGRTQPPHISEVET